jgi:hypothetical protein
LIRPCAGPGAPAIEGWHALPGPTVRRIDGSSLGKEVAAETSARLVHKELGFEKPTSAAIRPAGVCISPTTRRPMRVETRSSTPPGSSRPPRAGRSSEVCGPLLLPYYEYRAGLLRLARQGRKMKLAHLPSPASAAS